MTTLKLPNVTPAMLRTAFKHDLAECWKLARTLHPEHKPYAFVLYGLEGGPNFTPHVLTDESLAKTAQRYFKEGYSETLEESIKNLRFSVSDSPTFRDLENKLEQVNALLHPHVRILQKNETEAYELMAKTAMDAWKELDNEGLFGTGTEREQLLLCIITEDTEKDWMKSSAKKLNPPAVFKRFQEQTKCEENHYESSSLALSADAKRIYSAGTHTLKGRPRQLEAVAYDMTGPRPKRRWEFGFSHEGDFIKFIICSKDGQIIVAARQTYRSTDITRLLQFGPASNAVLKEAPLPDECCALAISPDDKRIAVGLINEPLHIFDAGLNPIQQFDPEFTPHGLTFLKSGDLLVAGHDGIICIQEGKEIKATPYCKPSGSIAADDANRFLVCSDENKSAPYGKEKGGVFGTNIIELPSFKTIKTLKFPELNVTKAAISPDGRYVASVTKHYVDYRFYVIVNERETGREIARRKLHVMDLKFLNDSKTLALGLSGFMSTEPIVMWPVPGL